MRKTAFPKGYLIVKLLVCANTTYAFIQMWHWKIGFTYFTQLSNLFLTLVLLLVLLTGRSFRRLRLASATSIVVTFLIFLLFLGPFMPGGLLGAYRQDHYASLCMHLLNPLLGLYDFFQDRAGSSLTKKDLPCTLLPPFLYLAFILLLGRLGVRWGPPSSPMLAPYPFLNYQGSAGWFGFCPDQASYTSPGIGVFYYLLLLVLVFLSISALLVSLSQKEARKDNGG